MTTKPHSNEEWREKMYEWCERNCKQGEFHFSSLIQIMYDELAQKDAEMKQVTAYALNVLKYCEQHPEKIGFYARANPDTIADAVVKGNVDHVGKLVADARMEWQSIETAPKTGEHILVTNGSMYTVAHYFHDDFYLSWNKNGDDANYQMHTITHWSPITLPDQTANPTN